MLTFLKRLFAPSPAKALRKRALKARLELANKNWPKDGPELEREVEYAIDSGRLRYAIDWGSEDLFVPGSLGAQWLKSKGLKLCEPDWSSFWTLRW